MKINMKSMTREHYIMLQIQIKSTKVSTQSHITLNLTTTHQLKDTFMLRIAFGSFCF